MNSKRLPGLLPAAAIALAGLWAFWPALRGGWIWDDAAEVARNPVLRDPAGLARIWLAPASADYFPLKSSVQWLEWRLWGQNPLGYHLVSLGLHLLGAGLFWRLLRKLGVPEAGAWLGGLIFAVHPLTVESVAWTAELKNTLSLVPLLLAMGCYMDFDAATPLRARLQHPVAAPVRAWRYPAALLWFLAALLCKTTVVMFPLVLLLHAWWRRGRIGWAEVRAVLPFFGLALVFGAVTIWFQQRHAILGADLAAGGPASRLAAAAIAVVFYAAKTILPSGLIPNYARWALVPPRPVQFLPGLALAALFVWLIAIRRRTPLLGLGWFALNLLPVLGLIPMAYLRISWVADHFAYLPMLGLIGLAAAAAGERKGGIALGIAAALLLAWASHRQAAIYRDDIAFWQYTVGRNPRDWLGQNDLGLALAGSGRTEEAVDRYRAAIRLRPEFPESHNNLGNAWAASGRLDAALEEFAAALRLEPNYVDARRNLANALAQTGRWAEAAGQYQQVLRLRPGDAEVHGDLGYALDQMGRAGEAMAELQTAIRLDPALPEPHYRLGNALGNAGRLDEAIAEYQAALRLRPDYAEAQANLGLAWVRVGRLPQAIARLAATVRLRPDYADAHAFLGYALAQAGRYAEAVAQYRSALALGADNADLRYNLALALRGAEAQERAGGGRAP